MNNIISTVIDEVYFMTSSQDLASQLKFFLSNASHPLEGIFYLIILGFFFRWRWPITWNNLLDLISAKTDQGINDEKKSR